MKPVKKKIDTSGIAEEALFSRMLLMERKRSERTGAHFLLVLIKFARMDWKSLRSSIENIGEALSASIRDTDITGWQEDNSTLGVIFTALNGTDRNTTRAAISGKIQNLVMQNLESADVARVEITFHFFPEQETEGSGEDSSEYGQVLYPDQKKKDLSKKGFVLVKRVIDVIGSLAALIVFFPFLLIIAIGIKLTSAGPVFYRQKRLGRYGKEFTFLKFRSMYVANDSKIHREFTQNLIRGNANNPEGVFKIQKDPRVTGFGRFLRASSLDELPQFLNVLAGSMSLVGPRPPIPYEFECYQLWHRRRILEAKPGITGLWQVAGRSRTTFDDMVRLDLQYIRDRSLWNDFKILVKTPVAMFTGHGAY